ncbi:YpiF family protein [Lysinibacillus cavernae]|uniref:YpiF family protein n=1 Tax=Lysinibacillus cavernae TaxID=2666135 RepID=UPI0012D9AC66|nr:YpiF family protein [Lysinibacillus cavernae]
MYFNANDVTSFMAQKDFIDTAIVPLVSIDLSSEKMKQSGAEVDFVMSLTSFIEQQFKGRLLVMPPFSYMTTLKNDELPQQLEAQLHNAGFKHVFFITCDHAWTTSGDIVNIIWLPAIPLESMDASVKKSIMEDQLRQVIPMLSTKWAQI